MKGIELVIGKKDGSIDNASIPIRWCLTKELLDFISGSDYRMPKILLQVEYILETGEGKSFTCREERLLFPLEQFIAYVPLSKPGLININVYVLGLKEGESKSYELAVLSKSQGTYNTNYLIDRDYIEFNTLLDRGISYRDIKIDIISRALDYKINIPKELFGKVPAQWLLNLINRYVDNTIIDQCQLRRRIMLFPIKLLLLILPEFLLRFSGIFIVYIILIICGFTNIDKRYLTHPLTYWFWDYYRVDGIKHGTSRYDDLTDPSTWEVLKTSYLVIYSIPLIYLIILMLNIFIFKPTIIMGTISLILGPALLITAIAIVIGIITGITTIIKSTNYIFSKWGGYNKILSILCKPIILINRVIDKVYKWEDVRSARAIKNKIMRRERYLTCNNDPHSVTAEVDSIPLRDRTIRLICSNIKNKVCKPLVR